jgi:FtsP/CotA-like multicopper oxidase with cupredoxin domain
MRNRILAGLGVAALATVGVAAPANAISDTSADLYVVHAVPGTVVDVFVNGEPFAPLQDFQPGSVAGPVDLPAGDYDIAIAADGGAIGDAVIEASVTLAANTSYTAVAHPEEGGALTLSAFVNDISEIPAGQGKITVRHTADAPGVDVRSGTTELAGDLTNGNEIVLGPLAADTYADVNVVLAGTDTRAIELGDVALPAGTNIFVHAYGPLEDETFDAIIFPIADLHSTPAGVPAGEAGLGQQSNSGLIAAGAALLLALAAAAVVVRRQTVGAER